MAFKPPTELLEIASNTGVKKKEQSFRQGLVLSFLAGAYIALGGLLALRCSGGLAFTAYAPWSKLIFSLAFPLGLVLVIICGADLFTGNCLSLGAAFFKEKVSLKKVLYRLLFSWLGNFLGSLFVAYFLAYSSGILFESIKYGSGEVMPWANAVVSLANGKCSLDFQTAFFRGIGCNWLVCLAVYAAFAAEDIGGKILAVWSPTFAFVIMGMEHCIANMFFVPLGIFIGTSTQYMLAANTVALTATWQGFVWDNLLPVTLGNLVGGIVLVAGAYALVEKK